MKLIQNPISHYLKCRMAAVLGYTFTVLLPDEPVPVKQTTTQAIWDDISNRILSSPKILNQNKVYLEFNHTDKTVIVWPLKNVIAKSLTSEFRPTPIPNLFIWEHITLNHENHEA